jgi:hypothetical protein
VARSTVSFYLAAFGKEDSKRQAATVDLVSSAQQASLTWQNVSSTRVSWYPGGSDVVRGEI